MGNGGGGNGMGNGGGNGMGNRGGGRPGLLPPVISVLPRAPWPLRDFISPAPRLRPAQAITAGIWS